MRALQLAAVQIQRVARGASLRARLQAASLREFEPSLERYHIALGLAHGPACVPMAKHPPRGQLMKYMDMQREHEMSRKELPAWAAGGFSVWCASRLASWWRSLRARWRFTLRRFRVYHVAAQQIQFLWRGHVRSRRAMGSARRERFGLNLSPDEKAALLVQDGWKRYANRRVFRYYRDLIQFRLTGDPAALLKAVNPREAALFDRALGIHVRFRLGGERFPPTLFYKVFLLNPLCDVGAFAPRDYTQAKAAEPHMRHNKPRGDTQAGLLVSGFESGHRRSQSMGTGPNAFAGSGGRSPGGRSGGSGGSGGSGNGGDWSVVSASVRAEKTRLGQIRVGGSFFGTRVSGLGPEGTARWYKRVENNGWRAVTTRVATDAAAAVPGAHPALEPLGPAPVGAVSYEERAKESGGVAFHYSRQRRREDLALKRKRKKQAWLKKMYAEGLASEKPAPGSSQAPPSRAPSRASSKTSGNSSKPGGGAAGDVLDLDLAGEEGGLDQLLTWSAGLDYDRYVANWHVLATSGTSGSDYHTHPSTKDLLGPGDDPDWVTLDRQLNS